MKCALLLVGLVAFLAGCSPHRASTPVGVVTPHGIFVPANVQPGSNYRGLFVGSTRDSGCCWTSQSVVLTVRRVRRARYLVLVFFVPNKGAAGRWFGRNPVSFSVYLPGSPPYRLCCYTGGVQSARIPLSPRLSTETGALTFRLHVARPFIATSIHAGADTRHLGLLLLRVFFR